MIIIGITGTIGAGKGTVVEYLKKQKGFLHFSVRNYLTQIIRKKGLEVNRDNMRLIANQLREKNSPSFIVAELYRQAEKRNANSIIESIRTPGEVDLLKNKGNFYLFAVDADPRIRYERIKARNSETDRIDFDTFLKNEQMEMKSNDPNKQNLSKCMQASDFILENNGTIKELNLQVEGIIDKLMNDE